MIDDVEHNAHVALDHILSPQVPIAVFAANVGRSHRNLPPVPSNLLLCAMWPFDLTVPHGMGCPQFMGNGLYITGDREELVEGRFAAQ